MGFDRMCRGWGQGIKDFRKAILEDLKDEVSLKVVEAEAEELREPLWERRLNCGLEALGKSEAELLSARKGIDWKVALARYLRESCLAPNRWLAERLHMGTAKSVSSRVSFHRHTENGLDQQWAKLKMLECVV